MTVAHFQPVSATLLIAIDAFLLWSALRSRRNLGLSATEWLVFLVVNTSAIQRFVRSPRVDPHLLDTAPIPQDQLGAISRRRVGDVSGLPLETVRRMASRLIARGLLREHGDGLRGPGGILLRLAEGGLVQEAQDRFLAAWGSPDPAFVPRREPRLVAYHLANTGLDLHLSLGRQYGLPPATIELLLLLLGTSMPVSQREAARMLDVPRETCRRWLGQLGDLRLIEGRSDGLSLTRKARAAHAEHDEAAERMRLAHALRRMLCLPQPASAPALAGA